MTMAGEWVPTAVRDLRPGATIRLPDGRQMVISRIESEFFGRPGLTALIEDSSRQWFKQPMPDDAVVDLRTDP
jgi:hypothetical protein